jgi:hypothetical protein
VLKEGMAATVLTRHGVRFRGPALTRRGREALSADGISLLERHQLAEWGGQAVEYLVIVDALDTTDAVARVTQTVSMHGSYGQFAPDPE